MSAKNRQKSFFRFLAIVMILFLAIMFLWILIDAYKAVVAVNPESFLQFITEPILWHKVGEILIVIPLGIGMIAFFLFWNTNQRVRYLIAITPCVIIGSVLNLLSAWGFSQKPTTDFAEFMMIFGLVLFVMGIVSLFLLPWIHAKKTEFENLKGKTNEN
jgi:hypothetical protein